LDAVFGFAIRSTIPKHELLSSYPGGMSTLINRTKDVKISSLLAQSEVSSALEVCDRVNFYMSRPKYELLQWTT
jgi:hypothetical protein